MDKNERLRQAFQELGCLPRDVDRWEGRWHGDFDVDGGEVTYTFCGQCRVPVSDIGECSCDLTELRIGAEGGV